MKLENLSEEALLKKASYAGRNLIALAILATLCLLAVLPLSVIGKMPLIIIPISLITAGLWILAIAARRGSAKAVFIVMVVMSFQLIISLIAFIVPMVLGKHNNIAPGFWGTLVGLAIIVTLSSSRNVLLELEKRNLWEKRFDPLKYKRWMHVIGGALYVVGLLSVYVGLFIPAVQAASNAKQHAKEAAQVKVFIQIIKKDEAEMISALQSLMESNDAESASSASQKMLVLEQKVDSLLAEINTNSPLFSILTKYKQAIRDWKKGQMIFGDNNSDHLEAIVWFNSGDKHKSEALEEFNRSYGNSKSTQK